MTSHRTVLLSCNIAYFVVYRMHIMVRASESGPGPRMHCVQRQLLATVHENCAGLASLLRDVAEAMCSAYGQKKDSIRAEAMCSAYVHVLLLLLSVLLLIAFIIIILIIFSCCCYGKLECDLKSHCSFVCCQHQTQKTNNYV